MSTPPITYSGPVISPGYNKGVRCCQHRTMPNHYWRVIVTPPASIRPRIDPRNIEAEIAAIMSDPSLTTRQKNKRVWHRNNIEINRQKRRKLYWSDPEEARDKARQWREGNPEKHRAMCSSSREKLKLQIMQVYGRGHCACCGESQIEFLTIDHVNNDGANRRRALFGKSFYQWLKRNGFPANLDLQVLCYNCNCAKKATGKCPHEIHVTRFLGRRVA